MSDQLESGQPKQEADFYNSAFERLSASNDVAGALAYSFYKVAKREWITDQKSINGTRPSDQQLQNYASMQTEAVLQGYRARAEAVLAAYAQSIIEDVRKDITIETSKGSFSRSFWPSFWACVAFTLLLAALVFIAALLGYGLPIPLGPSKLN